MHPQLEKIFVETGSTDTDDNLTETIMFMAFCEIGAGREQGTFDEVFDRLAQEVQQLIFRKIHKPTKERVQFWKEYFKENGHSFYR